MKSVIVASSPASPSFSVRRVIQAAAALLQAWKNRRDIAALADLDDHMLRDIGVTRADIQAVFAEPLRVDPSRVLASRVRDTHAGTRASARERLRVSRLLKSNV